MRASVLAVVVSGFAVGGCKGKTLEWKEHKLTTVEVGPFTFDIPKGWRDSSESADPQLANITKQLGPDTDARIIVRQQATNTDTNIAFMWSDLVGAPSCDQFASAMAMMGGPTVDKQTVLERKFGNDTGCSFWLREGKTEGKMFLRFHEGKFLTLQCMRPASGDADADATCEKLAAALATQ